MKAILLAAGRGSRMESGTADKPKCLMTLSGRTLLDRCVEAVERGGIARENIGVVTGYRSEMIRVEGATTFHNGDWERTNMFYSLTRAGEWLRGDTCLVSYTDIVFDPAVVRRLTEAEGDIVLPYYTGYWELWSRRFENPLDDLETFRQRDGLLTEIGAKPHSREDIQGQYMGLVRFTPAGWRAVEQAVRLPMKKPVEKLDMTTLLQHLVTLGHNVRVFPTDQRWLECDNQNDIRLYETEML